MIGKLTFYEAVIDDVYLNAGPNPSPETMDQVYSIIENYVDRMSVSELKLWCETFDLDLRPPVAA